MQGGIVFYVTFDRCVCMCVFVCVYIYVYVGICMDCVCKLCSMLCIDRTCLVSSFRVLEEGTERQKFQERASWVL